MLCYQSSVLSHTNVTFSHQLREIELRVQREINEKRQELLARESQLKEIEARMQREQSGALEQSEVTEA